MQTQMPETETEKSLRFEGQIEDLETEMRWLEEELDSCWGTEPEKSGDLIDAKVELKLELHILMSELRGSV